MLGLVGPVSVYSDRINDGIGQGFVYVSVSFAFFFFGPGLNSGVTILVRVLHTCPSHLVLLRSWGSPYWSEFCICDRLGTVLLVTYQLQETVQTEEG